MGEKVRDDMVSGLTREDVTTIPDSTNYYSHYTLILQANTNPHSNPSTANINPVLYQFIFYHKAHHDFQR